MVSSALKPQLIVLVSQLILFMPPLIVSMTQLIIIIVFQLTLKSWPIILKPQMGVTISQLVVIMSQPVILMLQMVVLVFQLVFIKPQTVVIISQLVVLKPQMVLLVATSLIWVTKLTMLLQTFLVLAFLKSLLNLPTPELSDLIILAVSHLFMVTQLVLRLTWTLRRFQLDLLVSQPVSPMRTTFTKLTMLLLAFPVLKFPLNVPMPELIDLTILVVFRLFMVTQLVLRLTRTLRRFQLNLLVSYPISPMRTTSLIWVTKLTMLLQTFLVLAFLKSPLNLPTPELSDLIILVVFHLFMVTHLVLRLTWTLRRFQLDLLVSQPVSPMRTTFTKLTMLLLAFPVFKFPLNVPMPELIDLTILVVFRLFMVTQLVLQLTRTLRRFQLNLLVSQPVSPMRTTLTVLVATPPIWVILRAMLMRATTEKFVQPEIRSLMVK
jgi:hypothetical protein